MCADLRRHGKSVALTRRRTSDVQDLNVKGHQHVRDQPAVTAPPEGLRAHHGRAERGGEHKQRKQSFGELLGRHVIGITTKRRVAPTRIGRSLDRPASTTERRDGHVGETVRLQSGPERLLPELREAT